MKRLSLLALMLGFMLHAAAVGISANALVADKSIKKLYLFIVQDEHYGYVQPLDSIEVTDGKFSFHNDTLTSRLFFISPTFDLNDMEACFEQGSYLFMANGENQLTIAKNNKGQLMVNNPNVELSNLYVTFKHQKDSAGDKQRLDSLDQLFYAARERNDQREMQRLKESTGDIYDRAYENQRKWLNKEIERQQGTPFGLYLYYTYRLQHANITNKDELTWARQAVEGANAEARQTWYYKLATEKLDAAALTVAGQMAPAIGGEDKMGKPVSLANFKGKYVLVDFWSSSCTWCRKETPVLLKTYKAFKDKNFTILGVSTDFKRAEWLKAIKDEGAIWDHLLLKGNDRKKIMDDYSIVGIPQILLVAPDGTIIAKNLRGNRIFETVKKAVTK